MAEPNAEPISSQRFFEESPGTVSTAFLMQVAAMEEAASAVAATFGQIDSFWAEVDMIDETYQGEIEDTEIVTPASRPMVEGYNAAIDLIQRTLHNQL